MEFRKDEPVISLSGVSCASSDGALILDDVDLQVRRGECLLLMGRSGSGKTTITKCINGLIPSFEPSLVLEGEVRVCGLDPSSCEMHELAELVGSVFQNPKSQFFNLTSNDELAFGLESRGVPVEEIEGRIARTVAALKAERLLDRDVSKMSGGEKQSLVFASADIAGPDVLVLDEPTANLDASSVEALHDEMAAVKAQGKTVVIAEHRIYFASDLIDRAVLIEDGRVSRELSPGDLLALDSEEREALGLRATDPDEALSVTVPRAAPGGESVAGGEPKGLELSAYAVVRGGGPVFEPVSVFAPAGKVLGVLGENGAGKSTFLRGLAGLERHETGDVRFGGSRQTRKERRRSAALVMQDVNHQLFTDSVWNECLLAVGGRDDEPTRARIGETLSRLDLSDKAQAHPMSLSGGQKQRLSLACALLSDRRVLLLDEPTSGLDFEHMVEVARLVRGLAEAGAAVVLVTHDRELLNRCCDGVVELGVPAGKGAAR